MTKPEDAFFQRFPEGCPDCGGPKRYVVFSTLEKPSKAFSLVMGGWLWALASSKGSKAHFAECQRCHESWVWQEATEAWLNTREVQRSRKRRAVTGRRPKRPDEDIGKLY